MKIKSSEYSKALYAYNTTVSSLESLAKTTHLPDDLKKKIKELHIKFKAYNIAQHKEIGINLEGKILTVEEIKEIVLDATGYTRWSVYKDEDDLDHSWLLEHFGIDVDVEKIVTYMVERNTNSRSEIFLIKVTVLPGNVYLTFDTGRAGYGIEHLVDNKDMKKNIESQFKD